MLFREAPSDFNPAYETVSCFCENNGEILLLKRQTNKREPNKWGIPAGKIEPDETRDEALLREVWEETGWKLKAQDLHYSSGVYVRYPDHDFIFHMYRSAIQSRSGLILQPKEHQDFGWTSPEESLKMDLVTDFPECIRICYGLNDRVVLPTRPG